MGFPIPPNSGIKRCRNYYDLLKQAIEAAGIDIIIAQGIEAGGHRGIFNKTFDAAIKTSDLVHLIVKHCKQPVVAAGGI